MSNCLKYNQRVKTWKADQCSCSRFRNRPIRNISNAGCGRRRSRARWGSWRSPVHHLSRTEYPKIRCTECRRGSNPGNRPTCPDRPAAAESFRGVWTADGSGCSCTACPPRWPWDPRNVGSPGSDRLRCEWGASRNELGVVVYPVDGGNQTIFFLHPDNRLLSFFLLFRFGLFFLFLVPVG